MTTHSPPAVSAPGRRVLSGGPQGRGHTRGTERSRKHNPGPADQDGVAEAAGAERTGEAGGGDDRGARDRDARRRQAGRPAFRRQPAEGDARPLARFGPAHPHSRRADARHRCRRARGNRVADPQTFRAGHGAAGGVVRARRTGRRERPDSGAARSQEGRRDRSATTSTGRPSSARLRARGHDALIATPRRTGRPICGSARSQDIGRFGRWSRSRSSSPSTAPYRPVSSTFASWRAACSAT